MPYCRKRHHDPKNQVPTKGQVSTNRDGEKTVPCATVLCCDVQQVPRAIDTPRGDTPWNTTVLQPWPGKSFEKVPGIQCIGLSNKFDCNSSTWRCLASLHQGTCASSHNHNRRRQAQTESNQKQLPWQTLYSKKSWFANAQNALFQNRGTCIFWSTLVFLK